MKIPNGLLVHKLFTIYGQQPVIMIHVKMPAVSITAPIFEKNPHKNAVFSLVSRKTAANLNHV